MSGTGAIGEEKLRGSPESQTRVIVFGADERFAMSRFYHNLRVKRFGALTDKSGVEFAEMKGKVLSIMIVLAGAVSAVGQTAGGAKAGLGRVFDAAGKSAAARGVQEKLNGGLLKMAVARSKVPKAKATAIRTPPSTSAAKNRPSTVASAVVEPSYEPSYTDFRPATGTDFVERFASALSTNPNEKELVRQLVTLTRTEFEKEVAKRGRANNLAAALTFFIASTVTVYHNDPEPSDEAIDQLWDGLNATLNGLPEMSKLTDAEKQEMYEMLVACGGLVLAGHMLSKEGGDTNSAAVYRQLAGELIKKVMHSDPDKVRFDSNGFNIAS